MQAKVYYTFNNDVTSAEFHIAKANTLVKFGSVTQTDSTVTTGSLTTDVFDNVGEGSTLDFQNGAIQNNTLGAVTLGANLNLKIDVDLVGTTTSDVPSADNFSATSFDESGATYKFLLGDIKVLSDTTAEHTIITVADSYLKSNFALTTTSNKIINFAGHNPDNKYVVHYKPETGKLIFVYMRPDDLYHYVQMTDSTRTYEMGADDNLYIDLGTMQGAGSTLNIIGNGYGINGYDSNRRCRQGP